MENNKKKRGLDDVRAFAKQRPKVFTVYVILRLLVVAALVRSAMLKEYESMFVCLLVLVLFMLPSFLERKLKIELPDTLEIIILVFIFAAEILGELECYFIQYLGYHTAHHLRLFVRRDRLLSGKPAEQRQPNQPQSFPAVYGNRRILLFHDHRRAVGIHRVFR